MPLRKPQKISNPDVTDFTDLYAFLWVKF